MLIENGFAQSGKWVCTCIIDVHIYIRMRRAMPLVKYIKDVALVPRRIIIYYAQIWMKDGKIWQNSDI